MTIAAAMEFVSRNVRVNSVHSGPIDTSMLGDSDRLKIAFNVPTKRLGQSEDIDGTVAFLLLDDCSYMKGAEIAVDWAATV